MAEYLQQPPINYIQHLKRGEHIRRISKRRSRMRNLGIAGVAAVSIAASLVGVRLNLLPQQSQQSDSQPYATSITKTETPTVGNTWRQVTDITNLSSWMSEQKDLFDPLIVTPLDTTKLQAIIKAVNPPGVDWSNIKRGTPIEVPTVQGMTAFFNAFHHNPHSDAITSVFVHEGRTYDDTVMYAAIQPQTLLPLNSPYLKQLLDIEHLVFDNPNDPNYLKAPSTGQYYDVLSGPMIRQLLQLLESSHPQN